MSIASNMKELTLQSYETVKSKSGAKKQQWIDKDNIMISIFETDNMTYTTNVKYNESTHVGFTFYKDISIKNRLADGTKVYEITDVKNNGRLTNLLLKVVETDG